MGIVDARKNNVRVLVQQLDATRERFRVGELTITDVSQAEARLEQAKADLVLAEAQVRIDQATFLRIVGVRPGNLGELPLVGELHERHSCQTIDDQGYDQEDKGRHIRVSLTQYFGGPCLL